jgi:hypothetical protein
MRLLDRLVEKNPFLEPSLLDLEPSPRADRSSEEGSNIVVSLSEDSSNEVAQQRQRHTHAHFKIAAVLHSQVLPQLWALLSSQHAGDPPPASLVDVAVCMLARLPRLLHRDLHQILVCAQAPHASLRRCVALFFNHHFLRLANFVWKSLRGIVFYIFFHRCPNSSAGTLFDVVMGRTDVGEPVPFLPPKSAWLAQLASIAR